MKDEEVKNNNLTIIFSLLYRWKKKSKKMWHKWLNIIIWNGYTYIEATEYKNSPDLKKTQSWSPYKQQFLISCGLALQNLRGPAQFHYKPEQHPVTWFHQQKVTTTFLPHAPFSEKYTLFCNNKTWQWKCCRLCSLHKWHL